MKISSPEELEAVQAIDSFHKKLEVEAEDKYLARMDDESLDEIVQRLLLNRRDIASLIAQQTGKTINEVTRESEEIANMDVVLQRFLAEQMRRAINRTEQAMIASQIEPMKLTNR